MQEAKDFLRIDGSEQDGVLTALIVAARQYAEAYTKRQFCTATYRLTLDSWAAKTRIPRPPTISISSIAYIDPNGATQTLSANVYQLVNDPEGAFVELAPAQIWPAVRVQREAIAITYTAGYGAAANVPATIKQAMLMLIGNWYENRETVVIGNIVNELPMATATLLDMNKAWDLVWSGPTDSSSSVWGTV